MENRLHHLDLLRGSMMFLGVLVHASHADYGTETYDMVRFISDSFRMACFFIISGYFSAMLFERKNSASFFSNRLILLLLPALLCTVLLVPITNYWMQLYFTKEDPAAKFLSGWMGHAWFLYVLVVYTLATPIIVTCLRKLLKYMDQESTRNILLLVIFTLVVLGSIGSAKVIYKFGHLIPFYKTLELLLTSTLIYLPYFVLGVYLHISSQLFALSHRHQSFWTIIAIALITYRHSISEQQTVNTLQHIYSLSVDYVTAIAISFALFSLTSHLLKRSSSTIRLISDSSYTVYILHFFFVATTLLVAQKLDIAINIRFITAFLIAALAGVCIHVYLVKRYWIFRLLINGRMPAQWPQLPKTSSKTDVTGRF